MWIFWKKPLFWIILFLILLTIIPLSVYFFKDTILSLLPSGVKTQTQTPAEPKAGSCLILEEQYCSKAEVVEWTNPDGEKSKLVGFKLPAGTPILMPIEGNISRGQLPETSPMQGFQATVSDPKNPNPYWYRFYGNIEWITPSPHEKGKAFARIGKTGITNAGGYDLLVAVHRGIGMNTVRAEDELRKMFPDKQ